MKLHYITIQPTTSKMSEELLALEKTFLTKVAFQPLATYEGELHTLIKGEKWGAAEELFEQFKVSVKQMNPAVPPWAPRLEQLLTIEAQRVQGKDQQIWVKSVYKCVKEIRQEYWLAWLEDFFCEKIEWALQHCTQGQKDGEEHLYCVALPEFTFVDSGNAVQEFYGPGEKGSRAFYKSVVTKFLLGCLPDDVPRIDSKMRTLRQLTRLDDYEKKQIIIFAGTVIGRNRESENKEAKEGRSPYYNMAPVFTRGSCVGVWEKQEISEIDGKSYMEQHRHVTWTTMQDKAIAGYTASVFSEKELHDMSMQPLSPVFEITVFQKTLRFALCICKDYGKPAIIGGKPAEVYVLLSYGMAIDAHDETQTCIHEIGKNVEVFLYCDGIQRDGIRRKNNRDIRGQVCIKRGDSAFWWSTIEESERTWKNIDIHLLPRPSYNNQYAAPGIYIAPNVLDWNPIQRKS